MRPLALLAVLASLLMAAPVAAAERWYTVELIVFERTSDTGLGAELWSDRVEEPRTDLALSLDGSVGLLSAGSGRARSIEAVPRGQLAFGGAASRLDRSGRYRTLLHRGWRQPGTERNQALPVRVTGSGLRGTVTLYLSRFLHVDAHLLYERPDSGLAAFELRESRRMRSGELHYFDHPLFGMLLRVLPYEPPGGEYLPVSPEGSSAPASGS